MDNSPLGAPGSGPWRGDQPPVGFAPFPDDAVEATVTERLVEMFERFPERTAVSSPSGTMTYDELRTEVERVVGAISRFVVSSAPVPVAVLAEHDGPLVTAILGTIAAGHIVVVLDPLSPAPVREAIVAECDPVLLLHDAAHTEMAEQLTAGRSTLRTVALETATGRFGGFAERTPEDPLMLAFTSGTSGVPKGAIITHGVLLNLVRGATNALGIGPDDRMPMLFPTSLAVAAYPLFLPLLNGGTLATLDVRSVGLDPVGGFLERERITLAYMAPTVVRFLVDALDGRSFPDLRMIALGGEIVDAEVVALSRSLFSPELVANGYGTTETGVVTLYVVGPDETFSGVVPVGHAVDGVELLVLDDHGVPLPPNSPGEIAVVSRFLFRGYWGHPELNRQVISPDPAQRDGWRMYRTGDYGYLDDHGALVVSGRVDTKVKIRGRFVVLGDVEAAVRELAGVDDAVVVAHERGGVHELVAYVVVNGAEPFDTTAARARLLERSDAFRVPSRWIVLDELPQLPNGKTDRRSLPEPGVFDRGAPTNATPASAGRADEVRRTIRDIWEGFLPVGTIGIDEDFFHLGGDSLLAAQMLIELERRLGVVVPMGELIHAHTVRELSRVVLDLEPGADAAPSPIALVQTGDASRPPLWFVPDLQGSAFRVRHLARELGADQLVWSFESPLLAGEPNRFVNLNAFAAYLLSHLREIQPEGPYWLAGYSFGGICAREMAHQLIRDGQEVAFLGVIDVGPAYRGPGWHARRSPNRPWFGVAKPPPRTASPLEKLRHYRDMYRASPSGAARHLMVRSGAARAIDPIRYRQDLRRSGRVRPEWRLWYAWEEHWKLAATAWDRTGSYPGRMHLFWESSTGSDDATMGWGNLVDDLVIHRFSVGGTGDHDAILEPAGASALGPVLRGAIDAEANRR